MLNSGECLSIVDILFRFTVTVYGVNLFSCDDAS